MAQLSNTEATRRQELGSAWIFRRALKDNIRYNSWEDIINDPKFDELGGKKGIYPEFTKEWIQTFYLQQKKMLEEWAALPEILLTSSEKGIGRDELTQFIEGINAT